MFKTHRTFDFSNGVKNNTVAVFNSGNRIAVIYHQTTVFEQAGSTITLKNGGWNSISTQIVINRALENAGMPSFIERKKGVMMVRGKPFVSGMKLRKGRL